MSLPNKHPTNPLSIRLAESVVFLRGFTDFHHPHRRYPTADVPPAMLRGLLTLHLSKPTRISSIEVLLEGKSTIQWPEGNSNRRLDTPEDHIILSARSVFFNANSYPSSNRSASLGPDSRGFAGDPFLLDNLPQGSPSHHHASRSSLYHTRNRISPSPPERRNSAGEYLWHHDLATQDIHQTPSFVNLPTSSTSPPYTPIRAVAELPVVSRPQTPTDLRQALSHHRARSSRNEENPGQMLEEFRNVLRMEMEGTIRPTGSRLSANSVTSLEATTEVIASDQRSLTVLPVRSESAPGSRSPSRDADYRPRRPTSLFELDPTGHHPGTTSPSPSPTPSTPPTFLRSVHHLPIHTSSGHELDHSQARGRRSTSRWSINVSNVLKDAKDMFRSASREPDPELRGRTPGLHGVGDHHVDCVITHSDRKHRERERKSTLGKLTAAVNRDEASHLENWKEFRKGTYTYPISFTIPSTSPPTVHCDFGAVIYRLKAVVHRPGALTSKLTTTREVTLVASPGDDDTEETHSIVVERQWDTQLRYLIALSGRSFVIGSQVPFNLTMVPMAKCKLYRLSVSLEEKTEYYLHHRQMSREQPVKRFELLSIRHPSEKNPPHILPLNPENASILSPFLDTSSLSSTVDAALSSLMGPGPWVLTHDLQLPAECGKIHFTYRHKRANISINHILKIVFRVERGDDQCLDPRTGKRRLFDIVVQTPIHILSCHCNPLWTALPRYALFDSRLGDPPLGNPGPTCACSGAVSGTSLTTSSPYRTSPVGTPWNSRPSTRERLEQPISSSSEPDFVVTDNGSISVQPPTHLASSSYQFARLMSGEESVLGEAPPRYEALLTENVEGSPGNVPQRFSAHV